MIHVLQHRLCRLCLFSTSCLKDIFENNTEAEIDICDTIVDLLRIEVVHEDQFPWLVCSSCLDKLGEFRLFKQRCVECKVAFESRYKGKEYKMDNDSSSYWKRIAMPLITEYNTEDPGNSVDGQTCENRSGKESDGIFSDNPVVLNPPLDKIDKVIKNEEMDDADGCGFSDDTRYAGAHVEVSCEIKPEASDIDAHVADIVDGNLTQTLLASTEDNPESATSERTIISCPEEENKVLFGNEARSTSMSHIHPSLEVRKIAEPTPISDRRGKIKVLNSSVGSHISEFNPQGIPSTNNPSKGRERKKRKGLEPREDTDRMKYTGENDKMSQESQPEEVFRCGVCGVTSQSTKNVCVHMLRRGGVEPLGCHECGKRFTDKLSLTNHLKLHMVYQCVICFKNFKGPSNLRRHIKSHSASEDGSYECEICPEKFTSIYRLRNHSAVHKGRTPVSCNVCGLEFTHLHLLSKHYVTHSEDKPYDCKICGKKFKHSISLKKHSLVHSDEKGIQCAICEKRFLQKWNLKQHIRTHDVKRTCRTCGDTFSTKLALDVHETSHSGKMTVKCDICGQEFVRKDHLARHIVVHSNEKTFECKECGLKYKHAANLLYHINKHHREKKYSCEICGKKFHKKSLLVRHSATHTKRYCCVTCGDYFLWRPSYEKHVRLHLMDQEGEVEDSSMATSASINPGINSTPDSTSGVENTVQHPVGRRLNGKYVRKSVMCEICGVTLKAPYSLKEHLNIHMGIKPYSCKTCGNSFTQRSTLLRHMRTHTRITRYICEHCGRGFMEKRELITHIRIHTGDRPYVCKFCGIGYRARKYLKVHEKGHTALDKPLECKVCKSRFSNAAGLASHVKIHAKGGVNHSTKKDTTQGDKPVSCQLCDKRFRSTTGLTLHLKVHGRNGVVATVGTKDSLENTEITSERTVLPVVAP